MPRLRNSERARRHALAELLVVAVAAAQVYEEAKERGVLDVAVITLLERRQILLILERARQCDHLLELVVENLEVPRELALLMPTKVRGYRRRGCAGGGRESGRKGGRGSDLALKRVFRKCEWVKSQSTLLRADAATT